MSPLYYALLSPIDDYPLTKAMLFKGWFQQKKNFCLLKKRQITLQTLPPPKNKTLETILNLIGKV